MRTENSLLKLAAQTLCALITASLANAAAAGFLNFDFTSRVTVDGELVDAAGRVVVDDSIEFFDLFELAGGNLTIGDQSYEVATDSPFSFGRGNTEQFAFAVDYGPQIWGFGLVTNNFDTTVSLTEQLLALTLADLTSESEFAFFPPNSGDFLSGPITSVSVTTAATIPEPGGMALILLGACCALIVRRKRGARVFLALGLIGALPSSHAALVQYEFTSVIRSISFDGSDPSAADAVLNAYGIFEGAAASGGYTLDTTSTDFNSAPNIGRYLNPMPRVRYSVGDLVVDTGPDGMADGSTRLDTQDGGQLGDFWGITSNLNVNAPGFSDSIFSLVLRQSNGGVMDGDGLNQPLPFDLFDPFTVGNLSSTGFAALLQLDGIGTVTIHAELTNHRLVPIPAAVWLFGSALVFLGGMRQRRDPSAALTR